MFLKSWETRNIIIWIPGYLSTHFNCFDSFLQSHKIPNITLFSLAEQSSSWQDLNV